MSIDMTNGVSSNSNAPRRNKRFDKFNILLTNARSLAPKIASLHEFFEAHDIDFACVTESWLKDGNLLARDIIDLEYGSNMKIIYKNRPARGASRRAVGGGVSFIYNKSKGSFKERKIAGNNYEMICVTGKIRDVARPVAALVLYIQPKMTAAELEALKETIGDTILKLKTSLPNPLIFVAGDVNRRDLGDAMADYTDIRRANFLPNRGDACLDVMYTNADATESVWPPLETPDGQRSDHDCVLMEVREERMRDFEWERNTARKFTSRACEQYGRELANIDRDKVLPREVLDPDELTQAFQKITTDMTNRLFPLRTSRKRSNEPPWITNGIRKLGKQRNRLYKREGKSRTWCVMQDRLENLISRSKETFMRGVREDGNPRKYFEAVKSMGSNAAKDDWKLTDLFQGRSAKEAGNCAAEYFSEIANGFEPILPIPVNEPREPTTLEEVTKKLKAARKPNSMVLGDVPPVVVKKFHHLLAAPALRIYNAVFKTGRWPRQWKNETTVIIPKCARPSNLAECRNIACTPFLSKVLESYVLDDLRKEIAPDNNQYGGEKGSSVNHLLVDLMDNILRPMDQGNLSVMLCVDFQKAFNRLDHNECVRQLETLGASKRSLTLVHAFLKGRSMTVRVGQEHSEAVDLSGGSPQGSVLGCFLYCATSQQIDQRLLQQMAPPQPQDRPPTIVRTEDDTDEHNTDQGEEDGFGLLGNILDESVEDIVEHDASGQLDPLALQLIEHIIKVYKYIDDTSAVETVSGLATRKHFSTRMTTEEVPAPVLERLMHHIITKAGLIGMQVNCSKTGLICFSPDNGCDSGASIVAGDTTISSSRTMKLLGFTMTSSAGPHEHVRQIISNFRKKFWTLIHLRRSGFVGRELFKLYCIFVRPILEANSVIFHPMLSAGDRGDLEKLQKRVVKLCFGFERSFADIVRTEDISSLEERRVRASKKFVAKALKNDRFGPRWFVPREDITTELRQRNKFHVNRARTTRYLNSPLVYMQRLANSLT